MTCTNTASGTDKLIIIDGNTSAVKCHMPVEQFLKQVVIKDATETVKGIMELNTGVDTPACYTNNTDAVTAVGVTRMLSANPPSPQMEALKLLIQEEVNPCGAEASVRSMNATASVGGLVGDWTQVAAAYNAANENLQPGALVIADGQVYKLIGSNWRSDPRTDKGVNWQVVAGTPGWLASAFAMGAPLGDWATVKGYYQALGLPIPVGARVIGSNGKIYEVTSGSNGLTDPTLGGAGWEDVAATAAATTPGLVAGTTPATFSGDTLPDASKVKVGDTWITGSNPPVPHSKNANYFWNGSRWQFEAGDVVVVATASVPAAVSLGNLLWTPVDTDNSVAVVGNEIQFKETGIYDVYIQLQPGAQLAFAGAVGSQHVFGIGLEYNGARFVEESRAIMKGDQATVGIPFSFQFLGAKIPAGTKYTATFYNLPGTVTGGFTLRVVRK